jgi:hypothetical protein
MNENKEWKSIGFLAGNGSSTGQHDYRFLDKSPLIGINYYRLRQIDFDDKIEYSNIVSATINNEENHLSIFPNPTQDGLTTIYLSLNTEAEGVLNIFDLSGKKVFTQIIQVGKDHKTELPINLQKLTAGIYSVSLVMGENVLVEKLMVKR